MRSEDDRFFQPLKDLRQRRARLPRHHPAIDGVPGLQRRKTTAARHLADFGVAMYCGFGRQPGKDGMETMRDHRQSALAARE